MDASSSISSPPAVQTIAKNVETDSNKLLTLVKVASEQRHKSKNESVVENTSVTEQQETRLGVLSCTTDQHVDNKKTDSNVTEEQHKENSSMSEQQETCLPLVQDTTDQLADKIYFHLRSHGPVQARNIHSRIFDD